MRRIASQIGRGVVALMLALTAAAADKPLTNNDVVALVKAELGSSVIIAKIKQAPEVSFDLSIDQLIQLKKQAVPQNVIEAVLDRSGGNSAAPPNGSGAQQNWTVRLVTPTGVVDLTKIQGTTDNGFIRMGATRYHNFPGSAAKTRIRAVAPEFRVATASQPNGEYF
ncbi:MAG: hypothetical protein M3Q69_09065, partial [Acidobacteriota bacterium]|nr:hypothetical protein [Acidobacteriota bacterium]